MMAARTKKWTAAILTGLLLILFLPTMLLISEVSGDRLPMFSGTLDAPGTQWYFGEKGGELRPVDIQEEQRMEPGKLYVLRTEIAYDGKEDFYPAAIFLVDGYGVKISYDGEMIFRRVREDLRLPTVNSLGAMAFSLPMGCGCQGRELLVELDPMLRRAACKPLPDIQFGDYATIMRSVYMRSLPDLILIAAILFLCVALVLIGGVHRDMRKKCLNLALFAVAFSIYRLTKDPFVQHMTKSPYNLNICSYLVLALLPIFLAHAYVSRFSKSSQRYIRIVEALCWVNFAGQALLHFTEIMDLHDMLVMTQICCALVFIAMLVPIVIERDRPIMHRVTVEIAPLFIGTFLDFGVYFLQPDSGKAWSSMGDYVSIGFLATLVVVIYEVRKTSEQAAAESLKSQFFQELAYKDALTGLGNRAAFDEEICALKEGQRPYGQLLCAAADLNGLKQINDTYGHQEGDQQIRGCAALLESSFKGMGRVFRVGGDEFNVILYDVGEAQWPGLKARMDRLLEESNAHRRFPLSIAVGCAAVEDGDLEAALRLADERMYDDKCSTGDGRSCPRRS